MRLTPGARLGPYEVLSVLGTGGMAEVYRARDTRLGRDVALKVVNEALAGDPELVRRFEQEARLAGSLNHPNVVAVYDVGLHEGAPYFITELLQGESLRQRLARGRVPLQVALEWGAQLARGLAAAHSRGIVHRDVKPENVFVTSDGHVKLIDFGIAKLAEAVRDKGPHGLMDVTVTPTGSATRTGSVLGTPGYMAPEQVRGEPVDARTDIFSLGAVVYEMLSGKRAFAGATVVESGYAILNNEPKPLPAGVPPILTQVILHCLEKEPSRRLQSASDLAFELELVRTPTGSTAETGAAAGAKFRRWRRWRLPLAGVLAALGVAASTYVAGRTTRLRTPSVELITTRLGRVSAARFSPDGRVIFSAAWDGQPFEVFARATGSPEAQPLGFRDVALLAVSPTGELAVCLRPEWFGFAVRGTLALVPEAGGKPRQVAENVTWADWSAAGDLAIVRVLGGRFYLEYPMGKVIYESGRGIWSPRVSPSGSEVAFLEGAWETLALRVVDRRGQAQTLTTINVPTRLAWARSGNEVWFTAVAFSGGAAIWATSTRAKEPRLVYQGVTEIELEDIAPDGRLLLKTQDTRWEVAFLPSEKERARRLSVFDSTLAALSDDGRQVLFTSMEGPFVYLRGTDGAAPLKLGPGTALALSPDEKWALARAPGNQGALSLLPIGPEVPRTISVAGLGALQAAQWFHDGTHVVFTGQRPESRHAELFVVPLDGRAPESISDGGVVPVSFEISRDDRLVAALASNEILTLYSTEGGRPIALPELGKDAMPVGWTAEGHLWVQVQSLRGPPSHLLRYDISNRRTLEERTFSLGDSTGVLALRDAHIAADGGAIAFGYQRILGYLVIMDGLAPPPR